MSMKSSLVYLQFHPVAYLLKLAIEMNMADLIVKVVKATNPRAHVDGSYSKESTNPNTKTTQENNFSKPFATTGTVTQKSQYQGHVHLGDGREEVELGRITKTTETHVIFCDKLRDEIGSDGESRASSTRKLREPF
jgi:hypothetical protein